MRDLQELDFNDRGNPVQRTGPGQGEIAALESYLSASLPTSYKAMLKVAIGAHPRLNTFVPERLPPESLWSVDIFYHLSSDKSDEASVWRAIEEYKNVLQPRRLPIACDEGGNQ